MQRGQGGRDDFFGFGDPFAGFGGFGGPGSFFSITCGGKDPFDDPFFTRPFESMTGPSMFGGGAFGDMNHGGFTEEQVPQSSKSKGPIIRELSDDDHDNVEEERDEDIEVKKNPKKHSRLRKEPYVQGKKRKHTGYRTVYNSAIRVQPQAHTFSFSSSFVSYGGPNGPYYTASTISMSGCHGVMIEESKEAHTIARKAARRLSRRRRNKGHSVTRRRNSDGRVDTMQTLHNLNQDELPNFNEAWNRSAREHLPDWNQGFHMIDNGDISGSHRQNEQPSSTEQPSTNSAWATPQFRTYL